MDLIVMQKNQWNGQKIIKDRNIEFLRNLKRKIQIKIDSVNIMMVHGSPRDPVSEYIFQSTSDSTLKSFLES
ncbi:MULTISPECIES: hypothetical protein [Methanobacterium]|uniref:Uncharacterized protein n=1 Tax=Methanobacterium bryantii TaxID=2161 RepID=A0A2A2H2H0_METBR|nr:MULTISPECIES: hypothetical protein [Methanobacterium]PAV03520.1 hypothetical protein ASJ80_00780 [Methanobacterium bryantii]